MSIPSEYKQDGDEQLQSLNEASMPPKPSDSVEDTMESVISTVLIVGVLVSLVTVVSGAVLMFVNHPEYRNGSGHIAYRSLVSSSFTFPHTPNGIWHSILQGKGAGFILLGLFLLLMTPITRVAISVIGFAFARDHRMALVTAAVLILLGSSFAIGGAI